MENCLTKVITHLNLTFANSAKIKKILDKIKMRVYNFFIIK